MKGASDVERRAAALREAFDASFASPRVALTREVEDLLAIRVGGDGYALRLRDLVGVVARPTVAPVPTAAPGALGVAGVRGELVAVFSLSAFLGYGDEPDAATWLALCGGEPPIALCFPELEGFLRLPRAALHAEGPRPEARAFLTEVATTEAGARPVVALPRIVATIRDRGRRSRPS
ncbi:MAG: chemotaxis protein CheW [Deltaproteobacteria bacterium]|nr:chemotaxis protein CheW [Deltaproteobacteria bacterium]